jgi:hypothetical protein
MGCLGIGILVPSGPGYFGAFQLSTYMALGMFFHEDMLSGPGAAFVFLLYATQVGFHIVAMGIGLLLDTSPRMPAASVEVSAEGEKSESAPENVRAARQA